MKKISFIIGFLVILMLLFGLVTYTLGELPDAQTGNSTAYNITDQAGSFWFGFSSITTVIILLVVVFLLFTLIAYFKRMF